MVTCMAPAAITTECGATGALANQCASSLA